MNKKKMKYGLLNYWLQLATCMYEITMHLSICISEATKHPVS